MPNMNPPHLVVTRLKPDVKMPSLGTPNSVGADIHAYIKTERGAPSKMLIAPRASRAIPTGLIVKHEVFLVPDIPPNIVGVTHSVWPSKASHEQHIVMVCSRSGMAKERNIFVTNSPGIIDPDYRGEVMVLLYNGSHEAQYIEDGDRIAQLILAPIPVPLIRESEFPLDLEQTTRGDKGFGSTGR
jgi:dUTP pyrophosphatase